MKLQCALGVAWVLAAGSAAVHGAGEEAVGGVAADAATTAVSIGAPGVAEANPLGWATVPIRLVAIEHAKSLPRDQGQRLMDATSASGWGAAANNLLVLAGASSAAPVVGVAVGYAVWKANEREREFWRLCAIHQKMQPGVKCEFKAWRREDVVRIAQQEQARQATTVAEADPR